jgi:hypothetical protein
MILVKGGDEMDIMVLLYDLLLEMTYSGQLPSAVPESASATYSEQEIQELLSFLSHQNQDPTTNQDLR